jgi:N-acetylglucosaminyldiphosphoundecaprenol N-acetyl-beta-D-mannosaminyltransferase
MIHDLLPKITDQAVYSGGTSPIGYVNIYNYSIFRKHPDILSGFAQFTLDGIFLVWMIRLLFGRRIQRKSPDFSSYFTELFEWLDQHGKKTAFIGGSPEEIRVFTERVTGLYPGIQAVLTVSGYERDDEEVVQKVLSGGPEVILLGMGSPRQELFALLLKNRNCKGTIITCGAFISQTATGGEEYYPVWINSLNLRWVYRIFREPVLFRRYFFQYPRALWVLLGDYFRGPAGNGSENT